MKYKKLLPILFFLVVLIFAFIFFQNYSIHGNRLENIKINGNELKIEIVNSSEKLSEGLGERDGLCDKCGMLFEFSEKERHSFWMKGMRFNLDIIWIDGNEIVHIAKNISHNSSETIMPEVKADKVLEIKGGLADRIGIKAGDVVEFK
jgi:hypothetical protein